MLQRLLPWIRRRTRRGLQIRNVLAGAVGVLLLRALMMRLILRPHRLPRRTTILLCDKPTGDAWELFLDEAGLGPDSHLRKHLRQLLARRDIDNELGRLYDMLAKDGCLSHEKAHQLSHLMKGQVRVHLRAHDKVRLVPPTPKGRPGGFLESFAVAFPPDRPLDRERFPGFAKLLIVRRVWKTLSDSVGVEQLCSEGSCPLPLVINITVDLGDDIAPFRIHTITPINTNSPIEGECLSLIEEVDTPGWSPPPPRVMEPVTEIEEAETPTGGRQGDAFAMMLQD